MLARRRAGWPLAASNTGGAAAAYGSSILARIRFVAQGGSELLVGMAHADWASGCLVDFDDPAPRVAARHRKESKSRLSGLASLTFDLPDFVNFLKMLICFFMFLFVEN